MRTVLLPAALMNGWFRPRPEIQIDALLVGFGGVFRRNRQPPRSWGRGRKGVVPRAVDPPVEDGSFVEHSAGRQANGRRGVRRPAVHWLEEGGDRSPRRDLNPRKLRAGRLRCRG